MTAYITPRDGIVRAFPLASTTRESALEEARLLAQSIFGRGFIYSVRSEQ